MAKARKDFVCVFASCPENGVGRAGQEATHDRIRRECWAHQSCFEANSSKFSPDRMHPDRLPPDPAPGNIDLAGAIAKAIQPFIENVIDEEVVEGIAKSVVHNALQNWEGIPEAKLVELIRQHTIKRLEVHLPNGVFNVVDLPHKHFERLLDYATGKSPDRRNFYLYERPGSFKSTAAKQLAHALNVRFGFLGISQHTPDWKLFGLIAADGRYIPTEFRQCYEHGGVFLVDELDNGSTNMLASLNGAIENGWCSFPDKMVKRSKEFVFVGTGNTNGRGADPLYPGRNPMDAAFLARFTMLSWDYDQTLERHIARSINPDACDKMVDWVQGVRAFCLKEYPRIIISPRETFRVLEDLNFSKHPLTQILEDEIWHGFDSVSVKRIYERFPIPPITIRS